MDQKTVAAYDAQAQQYENETKDFWDRFPIGFIEKFSNLAGRTIVDLGCGPGRDAAILRSLGHEITCVDASQTMVNICEKQGFKTAKADLLLLPFESANFDAAWAYTSFLHLPKKQLRNGLVEMKRVVKRQGIFGIGMIEGEGELYKETPKVSMPRFFAYYSTTELEQAFADTGFEVIDKTTFQPRERQYLNYILKSIN